MTSTLVRPLDVHADVLVEMGGEPAAHVRAVGSDVGVEVLSHASLAAAGSLGGPLRAARRLAALSPALRAAGLRVEVRVDGRKVAVVGRDARRPGLGVRAGVGDIELYGSALAAAGLRAAFEHGENPEGNPMTRINKAKLLICGAAFVSFLLSVTLWFLVDREQGLFVGIWVPSILGFGAVLLAGRGESS